MSGVRRPKVLVAMSGGVDSSVAAALLLEAGYDVVGCFMRLGSPGERLDELTPDAPACPPGRGPAAGDVGPGGAVGRTGPGEAAGPRTIRLGHQGCCSINDAADARLVAARLGVPFYVCNFKRDFARIIDYFADEYAAGRTPNPCVRCNDWLKFGKLHEYARQIDADYVASGHYARVEPGPDGRPRLLRGVDSDKDQSYVLFGVPRAQLGRMLLPVGGLPKPRVREMARVRGLPVFDKPDSQEICFVPDNDYAGLVERLRPGLAAPGPVVDESGAVLGMHAGQHRFTVGQRRGLGVALGRSVYVIEKDAASNRVVVGPAERLAVTGCDVAEANWLDEPSDFADERPAWVKFRSKSAAVRAWVRVIEPPPARAPAGAVEAAGAAGPANHSGRPGWFRVRFEQPQAAVAPGQALVVYAGEAPERVSGGGWIARAW